MINAYDLNSFDGTRIRYHIVGNGPNILVMANGHGATIDVWTRVFKHLPTQCTLITWDYRAQHGSDHGLRPPTVADHYGDLGAIVSHLGLDSFGLAGWSLGVQVALQAYRQHSHQVGAMALIHGVHGRLMSRVFDGRLAGLGKRLVSLFADYEPKLTSLYKPPLRELLKRPISQTFFDKIGFVRGGHKQFQDMAQEILELDLSTYLKVACAADDHATENWLHTIDVPVVMTVGSQDWLTPAKQITPAFAKLQDASLQHFDGTHFPLLEEPKRIAEILGRCAEMNAQSDRA
ncbi:MAG: hypothetical protein CMH52_06050 [Myxococcales bacterium]|nr:hypothetical protein [Myxococcales bacterium]